MQPNAFNKSKYLTDLFHIYTPYPELPSNISNMIKSDRSEEQNKFDNWSRCKQMHWRDQREFKNANEKEKIHVYYESIKLWWIYIFFSLLIVTIMYINLLSWFLIHKKMFQIVQFYWTVIVSKSLYDRHLDTLYWTFNTYLWNQ